MTRAAVILVAGLGIATLWWLATNKFYVRQTRAKRWAYGIHGALLRWHFGTRPTHADALDAVNRRRTH